MKHKVRMAVSELGYEPDLLAQGLRRGSTMTIGFVMRDISNPLFAIVAKSSEQTLRRDGYSLLLTNSDGDLATETADLALLRRRRIDGLIVSLVSETAEETRKALSDFDGPVVLVDRDIEGLDAARVLCDHYTGVRAAVSRLLKLKHRRIALITGGLDVRSSRERRRAYIDAFAEHGIPVDDQWLLFGEFDNAYATSTVLELLDRKQPPTAIISGGVLTTAGTLRALRHRSLVPGTDVIVVALDGWPLFDAFPFPVGVVTRDPVEMGVQAANLILEALRSGTKRTLVIPTTFDENNALHPPVRRAIAAPRSQG
jgi:LacI family transcriptional regulator